jgi:hypothetical protein
VVATFNFSSESQNVCGFYIGHNTDDTSSLDPNEDRISESEIYVNASIPANQPVGGAIQTVLDLNTNDRVFFIVQNRDAANDITVQFLKFTVTSLVGEKGEDGATGATGFQGPIGATGLIGTLTDGVTSLEGGDILSVVGSTGISVSLGFQGEIPTYSIGEIGWQRGGEIFPQTVGGVAAGTSFGQGTSINTILETLLFPYQSVSFSAFSIGINGSPYEVGQTAGNTTVNATWATSGPNTNWIAGSVAISANQSVGTLASGLNFNSSPTSIAHGPYRYETRRVLTFTISGQQLQGSNPSRNQNLNWNYRYYSGKTADGFTGGMNVDEQGFNSILSRTSPLNWSVTFSGPDHAYFVIPNADFSGSLLFRDLGNNLPFPFEPPVALTHTNVHGTEVSYTIFKSSNSFAGTTTLRVEQA